MVGTKTCALQGYFYKVDKELYRKGLLGIDTEKGFFFPASINLVSFGLEKLIQEGYISPNGLFLDAGSGDGRIIALASYEFGFRGVGVEHEKVLAGFSKKILKKAPFDFNNYQIIEGDFMSEETYNKAGYSFSDFDVVFNYENNAYSLFEKISNESPNAQLILIRRTLDNKLNGLELKSDFSTSVSLVAMWENQAAPIRDWLGLKKVFNQRQTFAF